MFENHLTILYDTTSKFPQRPAFHIAKDSGSEIRWDTKTYREFLLDIEGTACHWSMKLASAGLPQGSIIGLW